LTCKKCHTNCKTCGASDKDCIVCAKDREGAPDCDCKDGMVDIDGVCTKCDY